MGLEPTTFELEVQHASPLRHGGFTKYTVINLNLISAISFFFFFTRFASYLALTKTLPSSLSISSRFMHRKRKTFTG